MRDYTTQMDAARKGIITPEMKKVAAKEYRTEEEIRDLVAKGQVAICANKLHTCIEPNGVGSMLRTKINVNLGVSRDCKDYDVEMQKVMAAVDMGAEAIMDLSSHGNTQPFRRKLTAECPAMIGTVPVYDSVIHYQRDLATLTARDFIDVVRLHAQDGVDFVTLHCGIGNFRSTDVEDLTKHKMESEQMAVSPECCDIVNKAIREERRILAVGTTVQRALEVCVGPDGFIKEYDGWTNKFIFPPYDFRVANSMLVNFHLPYSTMLMMTAAFGGYKPVMDAYQAALDGDYRFGPYGDALLIVD